MTSTTTTTATTTEAEEIELDALDRIDRYGIDKARRVTRLMCEQPHLAAKQVRILERIEEIAKDAATA